MKEELKDNRFSKDSTIPCYQTDASFHLKAASFMDMAQELAYWAAQELGFGYDDLKKHHTAWVLSRMHIHFADPPLWHDETTLYTWHKGLDGLFFLRDFELRKKGDRDFSDKSKALVRCTSSWIVMDVDSRRLVRSDRVLDMVPETTQCKDDAIKVPCGKVAMPRGIQAEPVSSRTVSYSDIDILGHTTNARYMVWALDCIDYGRISGSQISDIKINFNKETRPGDTISLYLYEEDGTIFIEGRHEGVPCFCASIVFKD